MKRKIAIVACVVWALSAFGGGIWPRVERYLHERSIPPGKLEVQKLADMYGANLFDEALAECDRADANVRYADYEAEICYIRWAANRRIGHAAEADRVERSFLQRFPNHILAADMHFGSAVNLIGRADYSGAERELKAICARYPGAAIAVRAKDILDRIPTAHVATLPAE